MLVASAILLILAVGQTFVVATAGIDLSIASVMTLGIVVLGQLHEAGQPLWVAIGWLRARRASWPVSSTASSSRRPRSPTSS